MIQLQRLAIVLAVSLMATASPAAERIDFSFEIKNRWNASTDSDN